MTSFHENMIEYRQQLQKGAIQKAYLGLMEYLMGLRTHFQQKYPEYVVSGSIYYGYMDMTYFAISPPLLKQQGMKIAIVFLHEAFRFEVWLAANNKQIQAQTWKRIKESGWERYRLVPTTKGANSILEQVLVENPDFPRPARPDGTDRERHAAIHRRGGWLPGAAPRLSQRNGKHEEKTSRASQA